jgi:anti-sigma B factor antagonist
MFEIRRAEDRVVHLAGRLDAAEAERTEMTFGEITDSVTLDCSQLDYISSAGIGLLIELHKRLQSSGHQLTLVNLLPRVRNIFRYAGLDRLLNIE